MHIIQACTQKKEILLSEQSSEIKILCEKINAALSKFGRKAFAKLSTRSPKDALDGSVNDEFQKILEAELPPIKSHNTDKKEGSRDTPFQGKFDPNEDVIAFSRAIRKSMCVHSA